jgi:hypothetical protein
VDYERITSKYTGVRLSYAALAAQRRRGGIAAELATAISQTVRAIYATEVDLASIAEAVGHAASSVSDAIAAAPEQSAPTLNPLGELQQRGPRFDAQIGIRDVHIEHLRTLVRLWQHLPTTEDTAATT